MRTCMYRYLYMLITNTSMEPALIFKIWTYFFKLFFTSDYILLIYRICTCRNLRIAVLTSVLYYYRFRATFSIAEEAILLWSACVFIAVGILSVLLEHPVNPFANIELFGYRLLMLRSSEQEDGDKRVKQD